MGDNLKTGIIYIAINKTNGKGYVGQTTQLLRMRRNDHNKQIRNTKRPKPPFVNALIKYGTAAFEWSILFEAVPVDKLDEFERKAIIDHNTMIKVGWGYNVEPGGNLNKVLSEATRTKISNSLKGRKIPQNVCEKLSAANKGKVPWNKGRKEDKAVIEKRREKRSALWEITTPGGDVLIIKNLRAYCIENNINSGNMYSVSSGRVKQCKGYIVRKVKNEEAK